MDSEAFSNGFPTAFGSGTHVLFIQLSMFMLMRWRFKHPMSRSGQANGGCTVSARGLVNGTSFYILYDSIFSDIFRVVLCHVVYMYCIYYQYCSYITCALEFFSFFGGPQRFCALGCFRGFSCGTSEQSPCTEAMLQLSTAHQGPVAETESWNLN